MLDKDIDLVYLVKPEQDLNSKKIAIEMSRRTHRVLGHTTWLGRLCSKRAIAQVRPGCRFIGAVDGPPSSSCGGPSCDES